MPRPIQRLAFTLAAAGLLAACGGGTQPPAGTGGPGATAAPSAATGSTPGAQTTPGTPAGDLVACELLSDADIAEVTGATVVSKVDDAADTVYANHCRWTIQSDSGVAEINLGVVSPDGRAHYDRSVAITNPTPITGLPADIATKDRNTNSIYAVKGATFIDVFTISVVTTDEEIATRILENLGG